jgi:hypothetical protein
MKNIDLPSQIGKLLGSKSVPLQSLKEPPGHMGLTECHSPSAPHVGRSAGHDLTKTADIRKPISPGIDPFQRNTGGPIDVPFQTFRQPIRLWTFKDKDERRKNRLPVGDPPRHRIPPAEQGT